MIDLSDLGITLTDEKTQDIDQFNKQACLILKNPEPESPVVFGTPAIKEPLEPKNLTEPEQIITDAMSTEQNTANGKGEKCHAPKDFDGNEAKYKTWLRMTETYLQVDKCP